MLNATQLINQIPENDKKDLEFISSKIKESGYESYLIGGSVRDLILGKKPHEYDLTTSSHPEHVKKLFKRVIETGIQHGTVTVMLADNAYEITTFRKDIDYTDGRRPDKIEFGASLSEDMKRRDFTMNAIALDILSGKMIDENNGIADIQNKLIRTIGNPLERFGEDGLRPIRAIRFQSTLNFQIESETYKAIFLTRHITEKISRERFHDELNKILNSQNAFIGLYELYKNQIFELFTNKVFTKNLNLELLKNIDKLEVSPLGLRLVFLLNLLLEDNDKLSKAEVILKDFRYSKNNSKDSLFYLELFNDNYKIEDMSIIEIRKFLSKIVSYTGKREIELILKGFLSYIRIFSDKIQFQNFENTISDILKSNNPLTLKELAVNGNKIIEKFPEIDKRKLGFILQGILKQILEDPELNEEEKIYRLIETNKFTL